MGFLQLLQQMDADFFDAIRKGLDSPYMDTVMVAITNLHNQHVYAIGVAVLLTVYFATKLKWRAAQLLLCLVVTVAISDTLSYRVLKASFERPRPNYAMKGVEVKLPHTPTSYSFPSNHAVNGAAAVTIIVAFIPSLWLIGWFAVYIIGLSRIYVGVHYPSDVIGGWIIGTILGKALVWYVFEKIKIFGLKDVISPYEG